MSSLSLSLSRREEREGQLDFHLRVKTKGKTFISFHRAIAFGHYISRLSSFAHMFDLHALSGRCLFHFVVIKVNLPFPFDSTRHDKSDLLQISVFCSRRVTSVARFTPSCFILSMRKAEEERTERTSRPCASSPSPSHFRGRQVSEENASVSLPFTNSRCVFATTVSTNLSLYPPSALSRLINVSCYCRL